MPYIDSKSRVLYEKTLDEFQEVLKTKRPTAGELNYLISSMLWELFRIDKNYQTINDIVGILENVKLEFYRRKAESYENGKIEANGDLD